MQTHEKSPVGVATPNKANELTQKHYTLSDEESQMIEKFGDVSALFDVRPCAFDEFGELVDLTGTGLDSEYDAEILLEQNGQLKWV